MKKTLQKTWLTIAAMAVTVFACLFAAAFTMSHPSNAEAVLDGEYSYTLIETESGESAYKVAVRTSMRNTVTKLTVPGTFNGLPVVEVADNGFVSCPNLQYVLLSKNITKIGNNAFMNCAKLKHVGMLNVESIGNNAFALCKVLERLYIPKTVSTVGTTILRNNPNTVYVQCARSELGDGWQPTWSAYATGEIVYDASINKVLNLREIKGDSGNVIGYELCENQMLDAVQDLVIYNSVYSEDTSSYLPLYNICSNAFTFCTLDSIVIRDRRVDDPDAPAFDHKINVRSNAFKFAFVEEISFEVGATFIHPDGLSEDQSDAADGSPIVGDNGRAINIFSNSTVSSITLPSEIEVITKEMFANCSSLSSIKFYGREYDGKNELTGITEIWDKAFSSCSALENIYIPSTVEKMECNVFYDFGSNTSLPKQHIYIDLYEEKLPDGWSSDWKTSIVQDNSEIHFKPLSAVTIEWNGDVKQMQAMLDFPMPELEVEPIAGYTFLGVFSGPDGRGDMYYDSDGNSAKNFDDITQLYAYFRANTYTLTIGPQEKKVSVTFGQPLPAVGAAFKDGYIFNGYYYEESDGSRIFYYDKDVQCLRNWDKPTDAVLSADFIIQNYQINYMGLDGGSNHPDNPTAYNIESPTIQLNDPSRPGYIGSWDISSIPHGSTGNITVTAIWSLEYYTITYVLEDGWTNPDSNPSAYTILDSFVFEKPQKPGYTGEWDIKFIALGSTGDLTVNLVDKIIIKYTVKYDLGGGVNAIGNPEYVTCVDVVDLYGPTRDSHVFLGWRYSGEYIATLKDIFNDVTLFAEWKYVGGAIELARTQEKYTVVSERSILKLPDNGFSVGSLIWVSPYTRNLTIYSETDLEYSMYIVVAENNSELEIELVNLRLRAYGGKSAVEMPYGTLKLTAYNSTIYGSIGNRGEHGISSPAGNGGKGSEGGVGCDTIKSDVLFVYGNNVVIHGGKGGTGGYGGYGGNNGKGGEGGKGGLGGHAVNCYQVQINGSNIALVGGEGGKGGNGGSADKISNVGFGGLGGDGEAAVKGTIVSNKGAELSNGAIGSFGERGEVGITPIP